MPQKRTTKLSTTGKKVQKHGRSPKPNSDGNPKKIEKNRASTLSESSNDRTKNEKIKTSSTESSLIQSSF